MGFQPTDEQADALDIFHAGESMCLDAGAGTGKTSTLRLFAWTTRRLGRYLAFNKAIADDVQAAMPDRCAASTAHSLAFRAIGKQYAHRLPTVRMRSAELAGRLEIAPLFLRVDGAAKTLSEAFLAGHAMRALDRFCQTADLEPAEHHVKYIDGIDFPNRDGTRGYTNNNIVRERLMPAVRKAWADVQEIGGQLPFKHGHYLKLFQLSDPLIPADFILVDEAQDLNPVLDAIVATQQHAQRVYVGDAAQAIYEWTGAVNAMDTFVTDHRSSLTQSFRFGPAIAARANELLTRLDARLRLRGLDSIPSLLGPLANPAAVLTRTNAHAVKQMLQWQRAGVQPYLVGDGKEVLAFARAADDLMKGGYVSHPDLACFTSWGEVQAYVEQDAQGDELKLLVELVDEFGVETIVQALGNMPREADAAVVISTAHKAKGREWDSVKIAEDFTMVDETPEELRLQYVACTRARLVLDDGHLREAERMAQLRALRDAGKPKGPQQ